MPKKLTQQQVEIEFNQKGCELLSQYEGNEQTLKYRCSCGEIAQTSLVGFRKSTGCYKCSTWNQTRKFTYEEVKKYFLNNNCKLLDDCYEHNGVPMNYQCSCGSISKIRFRDFKNGRRCLNCRDEKISQQNRTKNTEIINICETHGCKFVESWIKCKKTRISYICKCGNKTEAYLTNFKRYPNCKKCGNKKISGEKCHMYDPDREAVALRKKFRKICGQHIRRFMEATNQKKTRNTHKLLGYTPQQLQDHILNHPDYEKVKNTIWHIDHIFPLKAFLDHGIFDLHIINALENLRPMVGVENLCKADTYDIEEFKKWLETHEKQSPKTKN